MPREMSLHHKINLLIIYLLPIAFYLIPAERMLSGDSICLYKHMLGCECWGCGLTRAVYMVMHCDLTMAVEYNPLVVVVFPLLLCLWLRMLVREIRLAVGGI